MAKPKFLVVRDPCLLDNLGASAGRYFLDDFGACLLKLRQFKEALAQRPPDAQGGQRRGARHPRIREALFQLRKTQKLVAWFHKTFEADRGRDRLRTALNSGIRRGEVVRHDAKLTSRRT